MRPLKKTLRINENHVTSEEFRAGLESQGWHFGATDNGRVWHVDRDNTSRALGSTLEHLRGDFYIQELSASMSVWHLAEGKTHPEPYRILEMAASPGGKTTQLSEHYPNAFIVANEFAKDRINALIDNIERMGSCNIAVTNYNGVQFRSFPEAFDRVLLDAPCSGEGIGFKAEESLKYWNIKNVKTIARLQAKLLEAGIDALRPDGELLYSTCTLNKFENEGVIDAAKEKFGDAIEVVFAKRFWPHIETAGGFFVAKIRKIRSTNTENSRPTLQSNDALERLLGRDEIMVRTTLESMGATAIIQNSLARFYRYKNDVLLVTSPAEIDDIFDALYCIRFGMRIGRIEDGSFVPGHFLGANFELTSLPRLDLDIESLDRYLGGFELNYEEFAGRNSYVQLFANGRPLSVSSVEGGKIRNLFPKSWLRR
ncbi:MAG: hypothetical protein ACOYN2_03595 [Patescibacteria group bacterium]